MTIKFCVVANKMHQLRFRKFYDLTIVANEALITEVVAKAISRHPKQCSFFHHEKMKVIYRQYSGLYFIFGATLDENELALFEVIQFFLLCLDSYFNEVTELDLMFNLDSVYMIMDEIFSDGDILETNKERVVEGIVLLEQSSADHESKKATGQGTLASNTGAFGSIFENASSSLMQHHIKWRTQLPQQPLLDRQG